MTAAHPPAGGKLSRRGWFAWTAAWGLLPSLAGVLRRSRAAARNDNPIVEENQQPGTTQWQLTYVRTDGGSRPLRCSLVEGYASHTSIRPGEKLQVMVSLHPPGTFEADVYRLGYYGGTGGRHLLHLGPFQGRRQPDPPVGKERLRDCQWEPSFELEIPPSWTSGVYLIKLTRLPQANNPKTRVHAYQSYVVFILRDQRPAQIVFQCSDNTWQAYNRWPDQFSLYNDGTRPWALKAGVRVSFNRPYAKYCQILDAPLSLGSGEFLLWEFPLAYWLEQHGYDVTYVSNLDVHRSADTLTRARCFLSVGHDEYWSLEQYQHVKQAIQAGVSVGFLSGNTCCFVSPYGPDSRGRPERTITRAGRFGGVSPAERGYMGPFPLEGPNEALIIGARTVSPFNGGADWIVRRADHWLFEGTGMKNGEAIPGLVGWEFHGDPASLPGLEVVASGTTKNSADKTATYTATVYPGPKGNWVFNAATIFWAQGLSSPPGHLLPASHYTRPHGPDPRVQRITRNFLERAVG